MRPHKAFTLIEVLVSLAILALIIFLSFQSFISLEDTKILEKDTEAVAVLLEEAKSNTRSSIGSSAYGVYLEEGGNRAVLFKGDTYNPNDPENRELILADTVSLSAVDLTSGGSSVVFKRPKGDTEDSGTITLTLENNQASSTITVYSTGSIEIIS